MIFYTSTPDYYNDYIAHFGILGMKWGKKNGPPYPLGSSISTGRRLKNTGSVKKKKPDRHERAANASARDAADLRAHGYIKEADAVQKVADQQRAKSKTATDTSAKKSDFYDKDSAKKTKNGVKVNLTESVGKAINSHDREKIKKEFENYGYKNVTADVFITSLGRSKTYTTIIEFSDKNDNKYVGIKEGSKPLKIHDREEFLNSLDRESKTSGVKTINQGPKYATPSSRTAPNPELAKRAKEIGDKEIYEVAKGKPVKNIKSPETGFAQKEIDRKNQRYKKKKG